MKKFQATNSIAETQTNEASLVELDPKGLKIMQKKLKCITAVIVSTLVAFVLLFLLYSYNQNISKEKQRPAKDKIEASVLREAGSLHPNVASGSRTIKEIMEQRETAITAGDAKMLLALAKEVAANPNLPQYKQLASELARQAGAMGNNDARLLAADHARRGFGQKTNLKQALQYCLDVASSGDARGYTEAARMLIEGTGKGQGVDFELAAEYIDKAIAMGSPDGLYLKGVLKLAAGQNLSSALDSLSKAATAENADAQMLLGRLYKEGKYLPENTTLAQEWALMSADAGSLNASVDLAKLLLEKNDSATKEEQKEAIMRLLEAANQNNPRAALDLAKHYLRITNLSSSDLEAAKRYGTIAYDNGIASGAFAVAASYLSTDPAESLAWLRKGAKAEDWRSRYAYGLVTAAGYSLNEAFNLAFDATVDDYTSFSMQKNVNPADGRKTAPTSISTPMPQMPASMTGVALNGSVTVSFIINEKGMPTNVQIVTSSHEQLNQPTVDAIAAWRFNPATTDGVPTPVRMQIPIRYKSTR